MKKLERITIAGFGGQGVMLLGQVLAHTGNDKGYNALWHPAYGPETRGGTANCSVILSEGPINSPVFSEADTLIIMNRPSLDKFRNKLREDGILLYNSSLIEEFEQENAHPVPANEIALKLGNSRVANMVMLGAYLALRPLFALDDAFAVVKNFLGTEKENLFAINLAALRAGYEHIGGRR
ncbi:MAG TPA: 2-oxoacid:ferredoxin oxidoreductase subunit gamma [Acholeplasmataceae bacterium]|nr:2-oxoacid:ferredoxin oxidoreductase subunit gamma [Acholeplasmataceae bacterium]